MFVLPNGTVVDPERADRQMLLSQIADRRAKAQADLQSRRQMDFQRQALDREVEMARAEREQEAALAREELGLRKLLSEQAEKSALDRLTKQFEIESKAAATRELSSIDAEEGLAQGLVKRLNDLTASLGPPPTDPEGAAQWRANLSRIRSSVPTNLEMALEQDQMGRWRVSPSYFQVRRSRWAPPNPELAAAVSTLRPSSPSGPTDELLARSLMTVSGGAMPGTAPAMATPSVPTSRTNLMAGPTHSFMPAPTVATPPIVQREGSSILQLLANALGRIGSHSMPSSPLFPPARPQPIRQIGGGMTVIGQTQWP